MPRNKPALQRKPRGIRKDDTYSLPAPTGGWNVHDGLATMPVKDAIVLENLFPTAFSVQSRKGTENWSFGFVSTPTTFAAWNGPASKKLFVSGITGLYDVTVAGSPAPAVTPLTKARGYSTNFSTVGGHFLVWVNGQDKLKLYDGTTWNTIDGTSTPAITGLATTELSSVEVIKRRLWFTQNASSSAWYLPVASIAGALTEFHLGQIFSEGGYLVAIGSWTIDGGDGSDDYTVFVSSEGQVAIYKGTDPASSTTFSHVGTYFIGEPLGGPNCLTKYGGDLLFLSQTGLYPLSKALLSASIDRQSALTNKIDLAFADVTTLYRDNEGWSVCVYPLGSFLLVNIPTSAAYSDQYVMNTATGAWCCFKGIKANDWIVFDRELYFSGNAKVGKAWTGTSDAGEPIVCRGQQAYSYLGQRATNKHVDLVRPILTLDGTLTISLGLGVDFSLRAPNSTVTAPSTVVSFWDEALWDMGIWSDGPTVEKSWNTVPADNGFAFSLFLQSVSTTVNLQWSATDFLFERASNVL